LKKREDLAAGVYAASIAFVFLAGLVGALVLPATFALSRWMGCLVLGAFFIGLPLLSRAAHRNRIQEAVSEQGGVLLNIKKGPFWANSLKSAFFLGEKFDLEYLDLFGRTHRARVNSGFFQGVQWLQDVVIENNRIG
jgi:hypothetical protein